MQSFEIHTVKCFFFFWISLSIVWIWDFWAHYRAHVYWSSAYVEYTEAGKLENIDNRYIITYVIIFVHVTYLNKGWGTHVRKLRNLHVYTIKDENKCKTKMYNSQRMYLSNSFEKYKNEALVWISLFLGVHIIYILFFSYFQCLIENCTK